MSELIKPAEEEWQLIILTKSGIIIQDILADYLVETLLPHEMNIRKIKK